MMIKPCMVFINPTVLKMKNSGTRNKMCIRDRLEIDPNAGELVTPTPAPTEPGVAIPGWGSITLPAGVTEAATTLKNPEANEGWYYLTFEMRLPTVDEETGEESYEVPVSYTHLFRVSLLMNLSANAEGG